MSLKLNQKQKVSHDQGVRSAQRVTYNIGVPVLLLVSSLVAISLLLIFDKPEKLPQQQVPTLTAQMAENLFTTVDSSGDTIVTVEDLKTVANKVMYSSRMPQMMPTSSIKATGNTLPEITAAFNAAWQAGDENATYKYGALIIEAAEQGNTDAVMTIESYVYGWRVSIMGNNEFPDPIAQISYDWLLTAAHSLTALGRVDVANEVFMHVVMHPLLERNTALAAELQSSLGTQTFQQIRQNLDNGPQASAGNETNPQAYEFEAEGAAPVDTIADTNYAQIKPPTNVAQGNGLGDNVVTAPLTFTEDAERLYLSPASLVIMSRDIATWLASDHSHASYEVTGQEFVRVVWLGKTYQTPFLLVHMTEYRQDQTYHHSFLLVWEFSDTNMIVEWLTSDSDGLETFADVLKDTVNFLHLLNN